MSRDRWEQLERIFLDARQLPHASRAAFVTSACEADAALRVEALSLLAADDESCDFLETTALERLARTMASGGGSLQPGERLGAYTVVGLLGTGGSGEVWRARDERLGRDVAIKVLLRHAATDGDRLRRFADEARTAGALNHANIVTVYDVGEHRGIPFLVCECLEGETLRTRLQAGPLPSDQALDVAAGIAHGLAAAHARGIIHRDLKPDNVFIRNDGNVKILDFGVAKLQPDPEAARGQTLSGVIVGTARYMAPEQGRGEPVDARADLFAFGITAYEMLAGQHPFGGASTFETLHAILTADPQDLASVNPRVPLPLARIVMRLLKKAPEARFQSAADLAWILDEVAHDASRAPVRRAFRGDTPAETMTASLRNDPEDLQQVRADLPTALDRVVCLETSPGERFQGDDAFALDALSESSPARSVSPDAAAPGSGRPGWRLSLAVGAAAAVVAALVWLGPRSSSDRASPAPVTLGSAFQATAEEGLEVDPTLSPDGTLLAYAAGTGRRMRVFIRPVAGGRTLPVSDASDTLEYQPRFSPDGGQILYLTPAGAFIASSLGGAARRIASGWIDAAAWAPDGRRVLVARGNELSVVPIDDPAAGRPLSTEVHEPHACAWAPDDTWIACVSGNRGWARPGPTFGNVAPSAIVLVPAAGGPAMEIVDRRSLNLGPVWGEDGRHLYFVSNRNGPRDIYAMEIGADGRPVGEPARISTGLGVQAIAFSAAARRLAYATYTARANIWSVPIPTREPVDASAGRPLTSDNEIIEHVSVSADGRWLVFDSDRHLNGDLFRMPIGGGPAERLTTDPAGEFAPELSPDGRELAFHSFRTGTRDIFIMPVDDGQPRAITSTPSQESYPAWSPDGRAIVYFDQSVQDGETRGLFLMRRDESGRWSAPEQLRAGTEFKGAWVPPDGRSVVTVRAGAIEVIDVESREARVAYRPASAGDPPAVSAVASADGRHIYFKSHDAEQRASLWGVPFAGGRPALLVRFGDPSRQSIRRDFAVGAGQFFFTIEERQADVWVAEAARR